MSNSAKHKVVVIGAGIGGLVSALLLACKGFDVTVVEKASVPGGKMRQVNGVDSGPTVFTMRWILEQVFASAGTTMAEHLKLYKLDVIARHAWAPSSSEDVATLNLYADHKQSIDAVARFSGPAEAKRFELFCQQAAKVYKTLEAPYIRSERPNFLAITKDLGPRGLAVLAGLGPFASLWKTLGKSFTDQRLRQLFGRYATYCGSSPMQAPATLMLVADVEMQGVWGVEGGMSEVAKALARLSESKGVHFIYNANATEIVCKSGAVSALKISYLDEHNVLLSSDELSADSIVFNGDVSALASGLLGISAISAVPKTTQKTREEKRSLSAITWSVQIPTSGFALDQHNVFFTQNYEQEFRDVFAAKRLPQAGTVYVCAQDRGLPNQLIKQGQSERLLCLVNAPAIGDHNHSMAFSPEAIAQCTQTHFNLLRSCGLQIDQLQLEQASVITTPIKFNQLFPATGGALYGQASHGWMNQFSRMGAVSQIPGLYLVGGSVHPGPGVPMAAMSGQLAAETIMAHLDSTKKFRRVVIAGGMSMPLATADNSV